MTKILDDDFNEGELFDVLPVPQPKFCCTRDCASTFRQTR
jgi:hypothetical protein